MRAKEQLIRRSMRGSGVRSLVKTAWVALRAVLTLIPISTASAADVVKDMIFSTLPPATTEFDKLGQQRLSELIDRIAQIPDEEIPEFPVATSEYKIRMGTQYLESQNFCEQAQIQFMQVGAQIAAAQLTNLFMVTVGEGTTATGINPMTEEIVPTQEMILAHRLITKTYGCM